MSPQPAAPEDLAGDLLEGAAAIGAFLGWPPRRIYHLGSKGGWPIFTDGSGALLARKSRLRAFIVEREEAAMRRGAVGDTGDKAA